MAELAKETKETRVPRKSRRRGRILIAALVVVVLAVAGFFVWRYLNTYETTDDAQVDGHIDAISARISGNVVDVLAEDEQIVKAGDVLVRIDPRDYEAALAKAEADLADAEAALETSRIDIPITSTNTSSQLKSATSGRADATAFHRGTEDQLNAAKARLETAAAQVREAQANLTKANDDVRRYKLLVDKDEIPRQTYDTAVDTLASRRLAKPNRTW
jgi:membrane fusion protein (multidrug efflux system)